MADTTTTTPAAATTTTPAAATTTSTEEENYRTMIIMGNNFMLTEGSRNLIIILEDNIPKSQPNYQRISLFIFLALFLITNMMSTAGVYRTIIWPTMVFRVFLILQILFIVPFALTTHPHGTFMLVSLSASIIQCQRKWIQEVKALRAAAAQRKSD